MSETMTIKDKGVVPPSPLEKLVVAGLARVLTPKGGLYKNIAELDRVVAEMGMVLTPAQKRNKLTDEPTQALSFLQMLPNGKGFNATEAMAIGVALGYEKEGLANFVKVAIADYRMKPVIQRSVLITGDESLQTRYPERAMREDIWDGALVKVRSSNEQEARLGPEVEKPKRKPKQAGANGADYITVPPPDAPLLLPEPESYHLPGGTLGLLILREARVIAGVAENTREAAEAGKARKILGGITRDMENAFSEYPAMIAAAALLQEGKLKVFDAFFAKLEAMDLDERTKAQEAAKVAKPVIASAPPPLRPLPPAAAQKPSGDSLRITPALVAARVAVPEIRKPKVPVAPKVTPPVIQTPVSPPPPVALPVMAAPIDLPVLREAPPWLYEEQVPRWLAISQLTNLYNRATAIQQIDNGVHRRIAQEDLDRSLRQVAMNFPDVAPIEQAMQLLVNNDLPGFTALLQEITTGYPVAAKPSEVVAAPVIEQAAPVSGVTVDEKLPIALVVDKPAPVVEVVVKPSEVVAAPVIEAAPMGEVVADKPAPVVAEAAKVEDVAAVVDASANGHARKVYPRVRAAAPAKEKAADEPDMAQAQALLADCFTRSTPLVDSHAMGLKRAFEVRYFLKLVCKAHNVPDLGALAKAVAAKNDWIEPENFRQHLTRMRADESEDEKAPSARASERNYRATLGPDLADALIEYIYPDAGQSEQQRLCRAFLTSPAYRGRTATNGTVAEADEEPKPVTLGFVQKTYNTKDKLRPGEAERIVGKARDAFAAMTTYDREKAEEIAIGFFNELTADYGPSRLAALSVGTLNGSETAMNSSTVTRWRHGRKEGDKRINVKVDIDTVIHSCDALARSLIPDDSAAGKALVQEATSYMAALPWGEPKTPGQLLDFVIANKGDGAAFMQLARRQLRMQQHEFERYLGVAHERYAEIIASPDKSNAHINLKELEALVERMGFGDSGHKAQFRRLVLRQPQQDFDGMQSALAAFCRENVTSPDDPKFLKTLLEKLQALHGNRDGEELAEAICHQQQGKHGTILPHQEKLLVRLVKNCLKGESVAIPREMLRWVVGFTLPDDREPLLREQLLEKLAGQSRDIVPAQAMTDHALPADSGLAIKGA